MNRYEFEEWLMNLDTQTLTKELKKTIWEEAEEMLDNEIANID